VADLDGLVVVDDVPRAFADAVVESYNSRPNDTYTLALSGGARVHRGPLDDVLARFVGAIGPGVGVAVRLTADCPLIDPAIVDAVVSLLLSTPGAAYASNIEPRTFPDGLDVEALPAEVLFELDQTVSDPALREHVTLALRNDASRWQHVAMTHTPDLGALRWTVDTKHDLDFVRAVVARLGPRAAAARLDEILQAIRAAPALSEGGRRG